ncbi:MAG: MBL fold metallo-hydrolase [archaeon]|nr:MBL fold metallo-hydrolase [archaeon]
MTKIIFLGTGGGRHTAMFQARNTGGFLIDTGTSRIHVDPGPGALTNMREIGYDLRTTDAIIMSHCHPDHCSDAPIAIEGMTFGGWKKRGEIYGSVTVMEGQDGLGPAISSYHKGLPRKCFTIRAGEEYEIAGLKTKITKSNHNDPTNVGLIFEIEHCLFSYVSDTTYSDEIAEQYVGTRILLLPITAPLENHIEGHMCSNDAIPFLNIVKPDLCIFTHLGLTVLRKGPYAMAKAVQEATGVRTVVGEDLMTLDISELKLGHMIPSRSKWNDVWDV